MSLRGAHPGHGRSKRPWQGERTTQTGTGSQVPLATPPGCDHKPEPRGHHSAGRQGDGDIGDQGETREGRRTAGRPGCPGPAHAATNRPGAKVALDTVWRRATGFVSEPETSNDCCSGPASKRRVSRCQCSGGGACMSRAKA